MISIGAIVRFLMLVACLVPFTSARQAAGLLASGGPVSEAPAPIGEEDDERETDTKVRLAQAKHRPSARQQIGSLPRAWASYTSRLSPVRTAPVAADPFRNGLGTPYRC